MTLTQVSTRAHESGALASIRTCDSQAAGEIEAMGSSALFERVSALLKAKVGAEVYASWFGRLKLHSVSKSVVRLTVPTTFLKSWINNRYLDLITSLFQEEDREILKVEILVRSAARNARPSSMDDEAVEPQHAVTSGTPQRRMSAQPLRRLLQL